MLTILEPEQTCECAAKGIPEGYICGKPECPRMVNVNLMLASIDKIIRGIQEDIDDSKPGNSIPL